MANTNPLNYVQTLAFAALFGACTYALSESIVVSSIIAFAIWSFLLIGQNVKCTAGDLIRSFLKGILVVKIGSIAGLVAYAASDSFAVFLFVASLVAFFIGGRSQLLQAASWPHVPTLCLIPVSGWALLGMAFSGYLSLSEPAIHASDASIQASSRRASPTAEQALFESDLDRLRVDRLSGELEFSSRVYDWIIEIAAEDPVLQQDLQSLHVFTRDEGSKFLLLIQIPSLEDYSREFLTNATTMIHHDMCESLDPDTETFVGLVGSDYVVAVAAPPSNQPIVGSTIAPHGLWEFYRRISD